MVRNPPAKARDRRDVGSILESGRSPGWGNANPFQYSCLGNLMDRGTWWLQSMGVAKESDVTEHTRIAEYCLVEESRFI